MSESYIKRTKRNKDFTTLGNIVFSSGLSAESLGVLCFILHLPDDWVLRKGHLQKHFKMGRDKMTRIFKELRENGYLADLLYVKGLDGKFDGAHYIIYDEPVSNTSNSDRLETGSLKTRTPENQCTRKPTHTKDYINKELNILNTNTPRTNNNKADSKYFDDLSFLND